jgi:hypothetical protein
MMDSIREVECACKAWMGLGRPARNVGGGGKVMDPALTQTIHQDMLCFFDYVL